MWTRISGEDARVLLLHSHTVPCLNVAAVGVAVTLFLVAGFSALWWACLAGVPMWHIKTARKTHVPIVKVLAVCALLRAATVSVLDSLGAILWLISISMLIRLAWGLGSVRQSVAPASSTASPAASAPSVSYTHLTLPTISSV